MGVIQSILGFVLGGGRNAIAETAEVFRENSEAAAQRQAEFKAAALGQFAAEFAFERRGWFDRFMDALNRLPRPAMALGTLALFMSAMWDPVWFASRMQGIALVPEPLWWLLGAIVSFYFGARYQSKSQEFQRSIAASFGRVGDVTKNIRALNALGQAGQAPETTGTQGDVPEDNAALADWMKSNE